MSLTKSNVSTVDTGMHLWLLDVTVNKSIFWNRIAQWLKPRTTEPLEGCEFKSLDHRAGTAGLLTQNCLV